MTEVEAARNIAAVQLERVRMQMAENIRPLQYALMVVSSAVANLGAQLSLSWGCAVFGRDFADAVFVPPGEPHIAIVDQSKHLSTATRIFEATLDAEGLARLEADPAARRIWVECWLSLQPQLQAIESIVMTKAHLQEPAQSSDLDAIVRGPMSLGREWQKVYGSAGNIQVVMVAWLRQWCDPHPNSRFPKPPVAFVSHYAVHWFWTQGVCEGAVVPRRLQPAPTYIACVDQPGRDPSHAPREKLWRAGG
jgi:hypothetical protein